LGLSRVSTTSKLHNKARTYPHLSSGDLSVPRRGASGGAQPGGPRPLTPAPGQGWGGWPGSPSSSCPRLCARLCGIPLLGQRGGIGTVGVPMAGPAPTTPNQPRAPLHREELPRVHGMLNPCWGSWWNGARDKSRPGSLNTSVKLDSKLKTKKKIRNIALL